MYKNKESPFEKQSTMGYFNISSTHRTLSKYDRTSAIYGPNQPSTH